MPIVLLALIVLSAGGCETKLRGPAVVVYASEEAGSDLDHLFLEFTAQTNIPITVIRGETTANTDNLIKQTGVAVDLIITKNAVDIWRAAENGALRPITSEALQGVPSILRDPDALWAAIEMRVHVIARADEHVRPLINSYDALADPELAGRLCLASSGLHISRSLIAMLIDERGVRPAERLVRRWVRGLAEPPFATEEALVAALKEGRCDYAIVGLQAGMTDLIYSRAQPDYLDIDGVGIARHARQPELAQQLLGWLLLQKPIQIANDFDGRSAAISGWRDEQARLLAERAAYH